MRRRLRDGTPVVIRPVTPEDRALFRGGFRRLCEQSRLGRFLVPMTELTEEQPLDIDDVRDSPAGRVLREAAAKLVPVAGRREF